MNHKKLGFGCILSARKFADTAVALSAWSEFCEECFKEKSNPPSRTYFLRHFYQDSVDESIIALNSSGIYVCIDKDEDRLCASVRVYRREIYDDCSHSNASTVAGIGEVCTLKSVRKQGIARRLMMTALCDGYAAICKYSMLHAASWIWPLYQSLGYENIYERLTFSSISVKENVHTLHQLYTAFSSRYFGPLKRSVNYFESWIASESDRAYAIGADQELVAYAIVGERYGTIKVKDFGLGQPYIDRVLSSERGRQAVRQSVLSLIFEGLTHFSASQSHGESTYSSSPEERRLPNVEVPTALVSFLGCSDADGSYQMTAAPADEGWMIRSMSSEATLPESKRELLFLYWPIDHF